MKLQLIIILSLIILTGCSTKTVQIEEKEQVEKVIDVDCPRGIVHDEYPGSCGLYVDKDNNHICDLSE